MRYTLHAPGNGHGDVTQIGWNGGRKRMIVVSVPAAGGAQPATPIVYLGHTREELINTSQGIQGGFAVTPTSSPNPYVIPYWTGDCYAVSSPDGVIADITSEEEHSPDWNQQR